YSAHADQTELLAWIQGRAPISGSLFLVHGEETALEEMRRLLQQEAPELVVKLPEIGEAYQLQPDSAARRTATGNPDLAQAVARDWQNDYAAFATSLKRDLARIRSARDRQRAIDQMRRVLDSFAEHRAKHRH
ncbi:MAG: hypothetical protein RIR59_992, partial [Pseudomonadota bacterium]